jgi:hypothetical protein
MLYYLRQPLDWDGVLAGEQLRPDMASAMADKLSTRFTRVWLVTIPDALAKDPAHLMAAELARRLPVQLDQTFGDKRLTLFAQLPEPAQDVSADTFWPQHPRHTELAPGLTLLGYDLPLEEAQGGEDVRLVTYWANATETTVQVSLLNADGGAQVVETEPVPAGKHVRVQTDLQLPPDAEGEHELVVAAPGEDPAVLDSIEAQAIAFEAPQAGEITFPTQYTLGQGIELAGYDVPPGPVAAGETYPVALFWRRTGSIEQDYKVFIHLVGQEFNPDLGNPLWGQVDRLPLEGAVPMPAWAPGVVIEDRYLLPVDPDTPPGAYQLVVGMYDGLSGERLPVFDAAGQPLGDAITLQSVEVGAGP